MSGVPEQQKALDLSGAKNDLWLVKVPKYLAEKWMNTPEGIPVGKLVLKKNHGRTAVTYTMDENLASSTIAQSRAVPTQYDFKMQGVGQQSLAVFSTSAAPSYAEKRSLEGGIVQKIDCRPVPNKNYMQLKKEQLIAASKPSRVTMQLEAPVRSAYKPVSITREEKEENKRRKVEGKKIRISKDELQSKLFKLFEKHQYYSYKDLTSITNQPQNFLSEVLKEICVYGKHPEHPHMWELREEYRHHSSQE